MVCWALEQWDITEQGHLGAMFSKAGYQGIELHESL